MTRSVAKLSGHTPLSGQAKERRSRGLLILTACALVLALVAGCGGGSDTRPLILVGVASSLEPLFAEIVPAFESANEARVTLVTGSSGGLAQQIKARAPIDVFASADASHADLVNDAGGSLVLDGHVLAFAQGRIVLVTGTAGSARDVGATPMPWQEVLADPGIAHLALANPELAPYGEQARAALVAAGLWDAVASRVVYGANVTQALEFVRSGNARAGFVALSQVRAGLAKGLGVHPVDHCLHEGLDQVVVGIQGTEQREIVEAFIAFMSSATAQEAVTHLGYAPAAGRSGRPECAGGP